MKSENFHAEKASLKASFWRSNQLKASFQVRKQNHKIKYRHVFWTEKTVSE